MLTKLPEEQSQTFSEHKVLYIPPDTMLLITLEDL